MTNLARTESQLPKTQTLTAMPKVKPTVSSLAAILHGVDMAAGQSKSIARSLNRAKHFTDMAQNALDKSGDENTHAIRSIVNAIMTLAILNSDLLHIHASYSAHVKAFEVRVNPASTNYEFPTVLFKEHIYLDQPKALEQLKGLEDVLIELVADAKDLAIGAC